ncbi:DUF167 family protein [Ectothiorhodospira sp. BSL-9]|uniref:DUF167 domain-containing protein n=1 Tax=Ectothiorhodospira sp. BSL-9 TaxID=1442136 RepID=UPI0007B44666|nr:DUF167 family protein [Ectothiorhodospira sp. BSL-9]ANB01956.1 hypothetical protein ECTOBSL9_1204 [Ectothiorhodospira sp. BSL-9]TVQ73530.1 MAG: hypothetical protein EA372_05025 [Chromatiaceae bacterium]
MSHAWWQWQGDTLLLRLKLQPRASRDKLGEPLGDRLKVHVTAPPVDGAANQRLIRLVSKHCGVARSRVELVSGATSREKTLAVRAPQRLEAPLDVCGQDHTQDTNSIYTP